MKNRREKYEENEFENFHSEQTIRILREILKPHFLFKIQHIQITTLINLIQFISNPS